MYTSIMLKPQLVKVYGWNYSESKKSLHLEKMLII